MSQSPPATEERTEQPSASDAVPARGGGRLRGLVVGLRAGAVATAVMSAFRMPISKSPPPTAWFLAKFVGGGEPDDYVGRGLLLHLVYGMGGGALFGLLFAPLVTGDEGRKERRSTLLGFGYGVALSVFGDAVIVERLLALDLEDHERFVFRVSHAVYGLTLGTWFGSRF